MVAIIPARGGSRRILGKNVRAFHGKPIIAYSIEAAQASGLFDSIVVSTDNDEIALVAKTCGATVLRRSPDMCLDEVGTQEVTAYVLRQVEQPEHGRCRFDHACSIYPCAPLLTAGDLRAGYEIFLTSRARYVYVTGWYYFGEAIEFATRPDLARSIELDRLIGSRWIDINVEDDWQRAVTMYEQWRGVTP